MKTTIQKILDQKNHNPQKLDRARGMWKAFQQGKGEFFLADSAAMLCWPATNGKGEGLGNWTTILSSVLMHCTCPSWSKSRLLPCKHMILLAGLADREIKKELDEEEKLKSMQVCSG